MMSLTSSQPFFFFIDIIWSEILDFYWQIHSKRAAIVDALALMKRFRPVKWPFEVLSYQKISLAPTSSLTDHVVRNALYTSPQHTLTYQRIRIAQCESNWICMQEMLALIKDTIMRKYAKKKKYWNAVYAFDKSNFFFACLFHKKLHYFFTLSTFSLVLILSSLMNFGFLTQLVYQN